jgi:hypothetical protein
MLRKQNMSISLNTMNQRFFVMEEQRAFCKVGAKVINIIYISFMLQRVNSVTEKCLETVELRK